VWQEISERISAATRSTFRVAEQQPIGGGSINQTYRVGDGKSSYFVKLNQPDRLPMFEAEAAGLRAIQKTGTIAVPEAICWGLSDRHSFLVLQYIQLFHGKPAEWRQMGVQLAQLHQQSKGEQFGWDSNNTIGSTPQINTWCANWCDFFAQHRLGYQLQLARRRGGNFAKGQALLEAIPELLRHDSQPALVHGDLWSGNAAFSASGEPIIFDPAVYLGDREVDLAMTELFGGFPSSFYQGYEATFPLPAGYQQRKVLYNLYHILNHFNLFGGSYAAQANRMIDQILAGV
jgi:fructosamine-3-kinase